ncbi:zinc knuckle CX2CX4HX4C containing protein [Tanacetum coccineum]
MKKGMVLGKDGKPMMAARREQFDAKKGDTSLDESSVARKETKDNTLEDSAYVSQPLVEEVNEVHNDVDQVKLTGWEDVEDNRVKSFANVTFVSMLNNTVAKKVVKLAEMTPSEVVPGAHVAIPMAAIEEDGMEMVLENGPWLIRLVPLILNVWTPNSKLKKDDITYVPIWVKMHNIPIVAYSEIGLSLITSTLGKPIMLDGYTSNMCINSWGRNSYARALIEVSAKTALLDSIVVAIPL